MQAQSARQMLPTIVSSRLPRRPIGIVQNDLTFDASVKQIPQALEERYGRCVVAQTK